MRSLHAIIHYVNQTCDRYRWSFAELIMEAPIAIIPVLASVIVRWSDQAIVNSDSHGDSVWWSLSFSEISSASALLEAKSFWRENESYPDYDHFIGILEIPRYKFNIRSQEESAEAYRWALHWKEVLCCIEFEDHLLQLSSIVCYCVADLCFGFAYLIYSVVISLLCRSLAFSLALL